MDRRFFLSKMLSHPGRAKEYVTPNPSGSLSPYTGAWTHEQAAHLLRRTTFYPNRDQLDWSVQNGLHATIEKLFEERPMPSPPVNTYYKQDPNVPVGATWVEAPYTSVSSIGAFIGYRGRSLFSWTLEQIYTEGISIREKLTLFWHNHFPLSDILDPKFLYSYISTIRSHATGNFRELTKAITIDPSMLRYLDGNRNFGSRPNENYARELFELFTIGKGPQVAPGDYSNFTELDVREASRVLTGWKDYGFTIESKDGQIGSRFYSELHDKGLKRFSHRFNEYEISNSGDQEYAELINMIFQQKEVARFLCRKLYRWFVFYQITDQVEADVIEPMAQILYENDFHIKPALAALLSSEHFYDSLNVGAIIKNPIEFIMSIYKPMEIEISEAMDERYDSFYVLYNQYLRQLQMTYYFIPEVAGWRAYYVYPVYYRDWINATTLPVRMSLAKDLATSGINPFKANGRIMRIDVLKRVASFDNPMDPNEVVTEFARLLLPKPLPKSKHNALKDILIPGLPDFEWSVEYGKYAQNPQDSQLAGAIERKLREMISAMLTMAEFQLS